MYRITSSLAAMCLVTMGASAAWAGCGDNTADEVPGIDKERGVIKLGTIQPITGKSAIIGLGTAMGIDIAVKQLNEQGGVAGCKIEMLTIDNQYQLDATVASARRLVDNDQVWAIVAPTGSAYIPAIYQTLEDSGTPLWAPISPGDSDVREVYLLAPSRVEQGRMCIDHFADQGAKKIASLSQNNDVGVQAEEALKIQTKIRGLELVANEKIDIQSPNLSAPVLNIVKSGAEALMVSLDPGSLSTALNGLHDSGFMGPICSDGGSAGVGGLTNVGAANPEASNGFLATLQLSLPTSEDPTVQEWKTRFDNYSGQFKDGAPGFSLQGYSYTMALAQLIERLNGDYSRENFHAVTEALHQNPIKMSLMPEVACGPLPGGHTCAKGAGMAQFDSAAKTWNQIQDFRSPQE